MKSVLLVAIAGLFLCGCLSSARRLEPSVIGRIKEGSSSRADVEKLLGRPEELLIGSNRKTRAYYDFIQPIISNDSSYHARRRNPGDILVRTLTLLYATDGSLEQKVYNETLTPVEQSRDYFMAGQRIGVATLDRLRKGNTTQEEVLALLGEPTVRTLTVEGHPLFIWYYAREDSHHHGMKRDFQRVLVWIDERGRVRDYGTFDNPDQAVPGFFRKR
jgi:outer membrane protein assembly factor BamE (lipoprotein component of BamABCDE complex)